MSIPVSLDRLREEIAERGSAAYLVTVGGSGPHVVSLRIGWDGDALAGGAGDRTAANVAANPTVTLLWPSPAFEDFSLLVDGTATVDGDTVVITPAKAVLHRAAAGAGDGPTCVKVLPDPS